MLRISSPNSRSRGWLGLVDRWNSRLLTATAIAALCWARLLIAATPFKWWRDRLGCKTPNDPENMAAARRLAAHVEWGATKLPFPLKCLPRAMALSWMLRAKGIAHCVVFAVRPAKLRTSDDQLHAWVESAGETIIGDLPGPWLETLRLGDGGAAGINENY